MLEVIDEIIKVGVIFSRNVVKPVWFIWKGRKYTIREVTYFWQEKRGEEKLNFFSVSDGANLFELAFDPKTMIWRLNKVEV